LNILLKLITDINVGAKMRDLLNKFKMHSINPKQLQYSVLQFMFWATFAAYYPFMVVFLRNKGFSNTTIGLIVAINSLIVLFAQPFWGMVSDAMQSIKKVVIFCLAVAVVLLQPVPFVSSALFVGTILALVTAFESPLVPLLDNWIIQGIKIEKDLSYGSIRLWGSLGFAGMVQIYGRFINRFSIHVLFPIFLLMGCITIIVCIWVKTDRPVSSGSEQGLNIGRLFKNYYYVSFLIFAIIISIPHRSAFVFLPNLMETLGGSDGDLGMVFAVMALSEVPVFLYTKVLLKKFKPVKLMVFSSSFFIIRQILYIISTSPIHLMGIQALQGPSFALFYNGMVYYIDELAPAELKSTAQTFANSMFFGLSGIIGSYAGGWIIDNYGLKSMYLMGTLISAGVSILFLLSLNMGRIFKSGAVGN